MRVSSDTFPFSIGTLKSTRIKTRFPARSRSAIDNFSIRIATLDAVTALKSAGPRLKVDPVSRHLRTVILKSPFRYEFYEIHNAAGITPLVVVPRKQLHETA